MPGVDWMPGVSQLKATLQLVTGDKEGAGKTMENFFKECPGVSQVTSVVQLVQGDAAGAWETQKQCLGTINNVANGIPVVGHVKGIVHHLVRDHEGGNQALNAATRTSVVIGTGAAAALATGGIGAIPAGIAAGASYDTVATVVTDEDQGCISALKHAVKNPSAGSIFDAVAIPVGDGIAGYSGGRIVAKKVAVNKLSALRDVKFAEMEMLSEQPGQSGAALKMSYEINGLTAEINTIENGTPVFWDDAKTGETAASKSCSTSLSSTSGYINRNNEETSSTSDTRVSQTSLVYQEDASNHDSYVDATVTKSNKEDKKKRLQELADKKLHEKLSSISQGVLFSAIGILQSLLQRLRDNQDPNRNPDKNWRNIRECQNQLLRYSWLYLNMPQEFPYTGAVQLNNLGQGLYHSFVRHINEWRDVISIDSSLIQRLSPLMTAITELSSADEQILVDIARDDFAAARRGLNQRAYNGRSVNANGHEQLLFKVKNNRGEDVVMCVCVSDDQFKSEEGTGRPLRIVITVFFMSWKKFLTRGVVETKDQMF